MSGLRFKSKPLFERRWNGTLSEYVTAIAWSPDGILAASSAGGEVILWQDNALTLLVPSNPQFQSIDCLAFSADGKLLAAGGQDGTVKIWRISEEVELITTLENAPKWVDCLSWSPTSNLLAFSLGRYVQIWDAETQAVVKTLAFEASSVLGMSWRPHGEHLAIAGNQGVKVWEANNWEDDPFLLTMPAASTAIAWSSDNQYLAAGCLDYTITVLRWDNPHPWIMRGFPGKIRNLDWSVASSGKAPLLAASSMEGIAVWKKAKSDSNGWDARILEFHDGIIRDLAFQPNNLLLASAGEDGRLCLWQKAKQVGQVLEGGDRGFSCLAWHPKGDLLAAGGQNGELMVWSLALRGKGFAN
jgi:WD40 repeat protein